MILYCKDIPVYDIDSEEVYNHNLLPGLMANHPCATTFKIWFKYRYSANTNSIARKLKGVTFGQGNRIMINKTTHALSLSDCYWVKEENDPITFEQISPYYAPFWTGEGAYEGQSVPTLYVGGYLTKEWVNAKTLQKYGDNTDLEYLAIELCERCGIPVNKARRMDGGIAVENITNPNVMIESAEQSGRLDVDDYTVEDIEALFGLPGIQMITIDAIVANGDRHPGNFGWLRDTVTGVYLGMSPLYDFDHALDSQMAHDFLSSELENLIRKCNNLDYRNETLRICETAIQCDLHPVFSTRAKEIQIRLNNL